MSRYGERRAIAGSIRPLNLAVGWGVGDPGKELAVLVGVDGIEVGVLVREPWPP